MKAIKILGGIGALLQSLYFVSLIVVVAVIMPAQGFAGDAEAFHTPQIALTYAKASVVYPEYYWIAFGFGGGLLLVALTIHQYVQHGTPLLAKAALLVGVIGAGFGLAETMVGVKVISELAELYISQPTEAGPAYLAINLLTGALRVGGWHAFGWWALLSSFAGLKTKVFARPLWFLGVLVGILGLGSIIGQVVLIYVILGCIWSLWLGVTLLRDQTVIA